MPEIHPYNSRSDLQSHLDVLVMDIAELGYWFYMVVIQLCLFGTQNKRHRRIEKILRRLSLRKEKGLYAQKAKGEGNKLFYTTKKRAKKIDPIDLKHLVIPPHDKLCMKCFAGLYIADRNCKIIPPKRFRGCRVNPDVGLWYPNGRLICMEGSTYKNVVYPGEMEGKVRAYERNFEKIEDRFEAKVIIVFILDIEREYIVQKVPKWKPVGPFRFIDFLSFRDAADKFDAPYIYPDGSIQSL